MTDKCRCKNPQKNTRIQNPTIYEKDHILSGIYPTVAKMFQYSQINVNSLL